MTLRRSTCLSLAAVLATATLTAGALGARAAGAAEPEGPYQGTYSAAATADGVRVTMTLPAAPLSNTVADVGGPTAQAVLDSNGASQSFASFPYPGANLAVAGGLVKGASNGQVPAPDYPFYVVSYNPTVPEQHVGSGPYAIQAQSSGTSSQGTASAGVRSPGVGTLGLAEAKASTQSSATAVVGSASSRLTGLAVGPLEIGELVSSATTALGADGKLDRKADTRVVAAKVGLTPVVIDGSGVSAGGTPAPGAPDTASVRQALASAGITVKVFAPEETETGIVAPVVRIIQTEAKSGAAVTYTLGGAAAFVQGTPAEKSSLVDDTLGEATPASAPPSEPAASTSPGTDAPVPATSEAAGLAAGAALTGQYDAPTSVPPDAGTLTVPDISSAGGPSAGPTAGASLGAAGAPGSGAGAAAASPGTGARSPSVALASGFLVTRSNATPMLIALTALIAVAMGAALGVHLLSKEARS
ncbi:MAG TPA: hypothetical protein VGF00_03855 [Acidimicrobiia bacterium]